MICVQPGKYWHCFKGNLGKTAERWGRVPMGLSKRCGAILSETETELNLFLYAVYSVYTLSSQIMVFAYIISINCITNAVFYSSGHRHMYSSSRCQNTTTIWKEYCNDIFFFSKNQSKIVLM